METKIIAIASEKGGVGKTTLSIMLATNLFHHFKKKVVLMDIDDPQFSVLKKRNRELNLVDVGQLPEFETYPIERVSVSNIKDEIIAYYGTVDFIIVDLHGGLTAEVVQGLMFVEHIFIPFDHDELEIESTLFFYNTLKKNFLNNDDRVLKSIHLFFNQYQEIQRNKFASLKEQMLGIGIPMMNSVVKKKQIYREQYRSTLYAIPEHKELGSNDIKNFFNEIIENTMIPEVVEQV